MSETGFFLDDLFAEKLSALAKRRGFPSADEPAQLGGEVRALSELYNEMTKGLDVAHLARSNLAARLSFSLPRDMAKGASAVRELVQANLLGSSEEPFRILDVGAGLGAMTFGVAKALDGSGERRTVEALLLDADAEALSVAKEVAPILELANVDLRVSTSPLSVRELGAVRTSFDLIVLGQVLSELDPTLDVAERTKRHLELLRSLMNKLSEKGALVIVEPALRDRTRHLHRLRDAIVELPWANVFAPCVHAEPCPALAAEGDWCHEDLPVNLPPWLVPTAKAAGLRWEGLTFSYLVLRKDGVSMRSLVRASGASGVARIVSSLLRTKGKTELFLCGDLVPKEGGEARAARSKLRRLDRDASESNAQWETATRGDLISAEPPLAVDGRVRADANVTLRTLALATPKRD